MDAATDNQKRWAELSAWGREPELGELDALMWRTERPPANSWTGIVVQLFDVTPEWERVRRAHEWFLRLVPRFTERVVEPVLPVGTPMWSPDPDFDLGYHLRRVRLSAPGSIRQLLNYAQAQGLTPMDRSRSPWIGTLVEGLEDGRAAYVLQAHHVLMDGQAVTQLLSRVLNRERAPVKSSSTSSNGGAPQRNEPGEQLAPLDVTARELTRQLQDTPHLLSAAWRTARRAADNPRRAARYGASLGRVLAPPPANPSKVLKGGSRRIWRFGMLECQLDELKAAGKAAGGTVNDTFVCILLGGLRRYCAHYGEDLGDVPISMPVAMRTADESMGGNKFAGAFFACPSSIADPTSRIQEMRKRVEAVRSEPALDFLGNLTPVLNRTPGSLAAALLGQINARSVLTTSSWPGVTEDLFIAGAQFERMFVFAPLPGTTLTGAMCTHAGVCCIGINVDGSVIKEPELLWRFMQESLDQVLALAPKTAVPPETASAASKT